MNNFLSVFRFGYDADELEEARDEARAATKGRSQISLS
jgi:hypothetical protein